MFWNKTLLKWEEPRFAEKYVAKQLRLIDYFMQLGKISVKIFIASYVLFWFIGWLFPKHSSNPLFSLELAFISLMIVVFYLFVWLITFAGSKLSKPQVSLTKKGLVYITVEGGMNIPYKKMESFTTLKVTLEENEYFVLSIKDWDGNESIIEIDPKIDKESIVEILKSKNVHMKASLINPHLKINPLS
jgi:hypothetical protein